MKEFNYRSHKKYFNILLKLPMICMIIEICLVCVWGLIDTAVYQAEAYVEGVGLVMYYGVMGIPNEIANIAVWTAIGIFGGLIDYIVLRIVISYKVLVIANLEKISKISEPPVQNVYFQK